MIQIPVTTYVYIDEDVIIEELFLKSQQPFSISNIRNRIWEYIEEEEERSLTSQQLNDVCAQIIGKLYLQGYDVQAKNVLNKGE